MKLSQIVAYLNLLESTDMDPAYGVITDKLDNILHAVKNRDLQYHSTTTELDERLADVRHSISKFDQSLQALKQQLKNDVDRLSPEYYTESWKRYEQEMCFETVEHLINRKLTINFDDHERLRNTIKNYTDWRLPGMIIRPSKEEYVDSMVSLDPLYLVDHDVGLLEPAKERYLPEYQRRLRLYTINDYAKRPIFKNFPENQFGLIFAYNYFNYKPLSVLNDYLAEMYQLLRPGGRLIFTYNNCDLWHCVSFAEKNFMCYTPGVKIWNLARDNGYTVTFEHNGVLDAKWIELKKPGEITSIKGGQSLAKIVVGQ
jgi:hypothetical protein